ncbi:MAG: hypothetical protein F4X83_00185 [Chloroflexi bacterium]|nr:hypothetical protein [Chloroflexota bacterium]
MSESFYERELDRVDENRNNKTFSDNLDTDHVDYQHGYKNSKNKKGGRRTPTSLSTLSLARSIMRENGDDMTAEEIIRTIEGEGRTVTSASRNHIFRLVERAGN